MIRNRNKSIVLAGDSSDSDKTALLEHYSIGLDKSGYIVFLLLDKNICCGYSLEVPYLSFSEGKCCFRGNSMIHDYVNLLTHILLQMFLIWVCKRGTLP